MHHRVSADSEARATLGQPPQGTGSVTEPRPSLAARLPGYTTAVGVGRAKARQGVSHVSSVAEPELYVCVLLLAALHGFPPVDDGQKSCLCRARGMNRRPGHGVPPGGTVTSGSVPLCGLVATAAQRASPGQVRRRNSPRFFVVSSAASLVAVSRALSRAAFCALTGSWCSSRHGPHSAEPGHAAAGGTRDEATGRRAAAGPLPVGRWLRRPSATDRGESCPTAQRGRVHGPAGAGAAAAAAGR